MKVVLALAFWTLSVCSLAGCQDPNYIGVQDYGYIVGNVVDQTGKAIPDAFVSATGTTQSSHTGPTGGFNIQNVATGEQTVTATAAGYQPQATPVTVIVVKGQGVQAGSIVLQSSSS